MKTNHSAGSDHEHFSLILDSIDAIAYVVEMKTNKILFVNKYASDIFGDVVGGYCWDRIWNMRSGPCEFCSGDIDSPGGLASASGCKRECLNSRNSRWYEIIDWAIPWNNKRTARIEIATDITGRKKIEVELEADKENLSNLVDEKTAALFSIVKLLNNEIFHRSRVEAALRVTEKKYRFLFEHAPDMYHTLNKDKVIIDCNQTEAKMLGYKKSEIIGRPLAEFFTEDSGRKLEQDFPKLRKKKSLKNLERMLVRKDGSTFPVILNVFADYDADGELIQTRAIARDISDLKKAERELKKVNRTLKALSDFNNALLHIKEEGELLNELCRIIVEVAGYRIAWVGYAEEDEQRSIRPVAYAGFDDNYKETIRMTWDDSDLGQGPAGEAIRSGEFNIVRDIVNDPYFGPWCNEAVKRGCNSVLAVPLFKEERVIGALSIYAGEADAFNKEEIDLIQKLAGNLSFGLKVFRSNAERELARAEAMRANHLASIGELAAGVAHEINNPVNGIINYAQILANKGKANTEENDIANRIIRESDRIASIVRNLLSFARDSEADKAPTNIGEVLSYALALTEVQIRKDGIKLNLEIPSYIPVVAAQPQQLEQVFLNIISNSRYALNQKYSGEHPNKILDIGIKQYSADNNNYLQTVFYDRGPGIPAGIINKIMNPFFSTKPGNTGTGLGLSISHGIISDHCGKLNVESIEGEFTRVVIKLPVSVRSRTEGLGKVAIP